MNLKCKTLKMAKSEIAIRYHISLQKVLAKGTSETRCLGGFRAGPGFDTD